MKKGHLGITEIAKKWPLLNEGYGELSGTATTSLFKWSQFKFYSTLIDFILTFTIIAYFYSNAAINMMRIAKQQKESKSKLGLGIDCSKHKNIRNTRQKSQNTAQSKIKRAVNVIALCITAFFLCNLPLQISHVLQNIFPELINQLAAWHRLTALFVVLNSVLNPFIYALTSEDWMNRFKKFLGRMNIYGRVCECRRGTGSVLDE